MPALKLHEENTGGRFIHLPYAVAADSGTITFHESAQNESGSLLDDHGNVLRDDIRSYEVETVDLGELLDRMKADSADYLKLDLEGAEYELLAQIGSEDLAPFRQVFIEFHHHIIDHRSTADTRELVSRLKSFGLEPYSLDEHNYLFLSPEAQEAQKALGAQA
ncbi:MAG: FkbM family methyltransferase [Rhodothermales bacterium]|nr:FkbM family methyltransferase [Rhodothermales bacterium]